MVSQALGVLTSAIGNDLQSSSACPVVDMIDEMVASLLQLICTAKPKIRSAAGKALQKCLASWPAETSAAVAGTDEEWRATELVQKLLIQPAPESLRPVVPPSVMSAAAVTSGHEAKSLATTIKAARREGGGVLKITCVDADDNKNDGGGSESVVAQMLPVVGCTNATADETGAVAVTSGGDDSKSTVAQSSPSSSKLAADNSESLAVGKSAGASVGAGMSSADIYGADREEGPYNALLDLLNSYVSDVFHHH